jgi:hypothetical protein
MDDGWGDEGSNSRTGFDIMKDQVLPELGLSADRMPQTEVALRLAEFILSLPGSGAMASVAIDEAIIRVGDVAVFGIGRFMAGTGWEAIKEPKVGRNAWTGAYRRGDKTIRVHSRPGGGDVIATVDGRRIVVECTKGPLVHKAGRAEHSLLTTALGQALLFDVSADDIVVAAVPDTPVFRKLAEIWRSRPLVRRRRGLGAGPLAKIFRSPQLACAAGNLINLLLLPSQAGGGGAAPVSSRGLEGGEGLTRSQRP